MLQSMGSQSVGQDRATELSCLKQEVRIKTVVLPLKAIGENSGVARRRKEEMICPTNLLESSYWNLSWLIVACTTREDPESGQIWTQVRCLARDNLETNSITMKPETVSHMVEQFSYLLVSGVPLPTGLCPGITSQSFALSALVSH